MQSSNLDKELSRRSKHIDPSAKMSLWLKILNYQTHPVKFQVNMIPHCNDQSADKQKRQLDTNTTHGFSWSLPFTGKAPAPSFNDPLIDAMARQGSRERS